MDQEPTCKNILLRLPAGLLRGIDEMAAEQHYSRSELIRHIFREALQRYGEEKIARTLRAAEAAEIQAKVDFFEKRED
jgi:metal-responsive CopG/Arc/MetJ family transcriptional regulator